MIPPIGQKIIHNRSITMSSEISVLLPKMSFTIALKPESTNVVIKFNIIIPTVLSI